MNNLFSIRFYACPKNDSKALNAIIQEAALTACTASDQTLVLEARTFLSTDFFKRCIKPRLRWQEQSSQDLAQEAALAILEAIEDYHPAFHLSCSFWTFALRYVMRALPKFRARLLDLGDLRHERRVKRAEQVLSARLGKTPSDEAIRAYIAAQNGKNLLISTIARLRQPIYQAMPEDIEFAGSLALDEEADKAVFIEVWSASMNWPASKAIRFIALNVLHAQLGLSWRKVCESLLQPEPRFTPYNLDWDTLVEMYALPQHLMGNWQAVQAAFKRETVKAETMLDKVAASLRIWFTAWQRKLANALEIAV